MWYQIYVNCFMLKVFFYELPFYLNTLLLRLIYLFMLIFSSSVH